MLDEEGLQAKTPSDVDAQIVILIFPFQFLVKMLNYSDIRRNRRGPR